MNGRRSTKKLMSGGIESGSEEMRSVEGMIGNSYISDINKNSDEDSISEVSS